MKKVRFYIAALALIAAPMVSASAQVWGTSAEGNLTGARTGSQIITGGNWSGFSMSWEIVLNGNVWSYAYTFTSPSPDISHLILGLTDTCTSAVANNCLFNVNYGGQSEGSYTFGIWSSGSGNPGFPEGEQYSFWGVKFDETVPANGGVLTITFDSDRAPVWGDFYAKGGTESFAYNRDLGQNSNDILGYIARPDGMTVVPEPSTYALMAAGLMALGFVRRRRKA
jgi:hypothetical protein